MVRSGFRLRRAGGRRAVVLSFFCDPCHNSGASGNLYLQDDYPSLERGISWRRIDTSTRQDWKISFS